MKEILSFAGNDEAVSLLFREPIDFSVDVYRGVQPFALNDLALFDSDFDRFADDRGYGGIPYIRAGVKRRDMEKDFAVSASFAAHTGLGEEPVQPIGHVLLHHHQHINR